MWKEARDSVQLAGGQLQTRSVGSQWEQRIIRENVYCLRRRAEVTVALIGLDNLSGQGRTRRDWWGSMGCVSVDPLMSH
jgi:hypothetical protein